MILKDQETQFLEGTCCCGFLLAFKIARVFSSNLSLLRASLP